MSKIANEASAMPEPIAIVEFLGSSSNDRKQLLRQAEASRKLAKPALADSVMLHVNQEVNMTFRPCSVARRPNNFRLLCYGFWDDVREPIIEAVTIREVDDSALSARVTQGKFADGAYDTDWIVNIRNIIAFQPTPPTLTE